MCGLSRYCHSRYICITCSWAVLSMRGVVTIRRSRIVAVLGIVFLASAVFGWGLKYKISLYNHAGYSTGISYAKLLSQKERPAPSGDLESLRTAPRELQPLIPPLFLLAVLVCGLNLPMSHRLGSVNSDGDSRLLRFATSNFFSFRPPPAPFPSNRPFPPGS